MSLQLPPFYHHPPYAFLLPRSLSRRRKRSPKLPCPSRVGVRFWASLYPTQARQCIWPYRVQHCFVYGLAVHLRLPPIPSFDNAVSFDYGQPVFCPMGTFTPLLVRTLRRTQGCAPARPAWHVWKSPFVDWPSRWVCDLADFVGPTTPNFAVV